LLGLHRFQGFEFILVHVEAARPLQTILAVSTPAEITKTHLLHLLELISTANTLSLFLPLRIRLPHKEYLLGFAVLVFAPLHSNEFTLRQELV